MRRAPLIDRAREALRNLITGVVVLAATAAILMAAGIVQQALEAQG